MNAVTCTKYQTNHLLLLVGGNPLPNAIAGKLLIAPGGTITLVHSGGTAGTARIAERLSGWLKQQGVARTVELKEVEESSATSIIRGVRERLETIDARTIGLHYTGGTKAMSVHAYRTVEQWAKEKNITAVFSYLDARRLEMVFDPVDAGVSEQRVYIGRALELKLTDLLRLHGWTLKASTEQPILPGTAEELLRVHTKQHIADKWAGWLRAELFQRATRLEQLHVNCPRSPDGQECVVEVPTRKWLSQGQLRKIELQWPSDPDLQDVTSRMKSELSQTNSLHLDNAAKTCGYKQVEDFCKWLDGTWLESAVLIALKACAAECHLHEVAMNMEPAGEGNPTGFEFDVAGMRGYQLFAFSCSTDTKKPLLKLKLFEAYIRARQLGGDEARVALVCCSNDPEGLEHEMRRDVDPEGRIRVFGRTDLADLKVHIESWIRSQSGKEA